MLLLCPNFVQCMLNFACAQLLVVNIERGKILVLQMIFCFVVRIERLHLKLHRTFIIKVHIVGIWDSMAFVFVKLRVIWWVFRIFPLYVLIFSHYVFVYSLCYRRYHSKQTRQFLFVFPHFVHAKLFRTFSILFILSHCLIITDECTHIKVLLCSQTNYSEHFCRKNTFTYCYIWKL